MVPTWEGGGGAGDPGGGGAGDPEGGGGAGVPGGGGGAEDPEFFGGGGAALVWLWTGAIHLVQMVLVLVTRTVDTCV